MIATRSAFIESLGYSNFNNSSEMRNHGLAILLLAFPAYISKAWSVPVGHYQQTTQFQCQDDLMHDTPRGKLTPCLAKLPSPGLNELSLVPPVGVGTVYSQLIDTAKWRKIMRSYSQ